MQYLDLRVGGLQVEVLEARIKRPAWCRKSRRTDSSSTCCAKMSSSDHASCENFRTVPLCPLPSQRWAYSRLPKADLLTFWFLLFGLVVVMAPKGSPFLFLVPLGKSGADRVPALG